jgi:hypothetical protein
MKRYLSLLLGAVACIGFGCSDGLVERDVQDATAPVEGTTREWRVLYCGWDENDLASYIAADIAELASAGLPDSRYHCLAVRASRLEEGMIEVIRDGTITAHPVGPDEGVSDDRSLYTSPGISTIRDYITRRFPAGRELLILAGHGRGFLGIGTVSGRDAVFLAAVDIPALLRDTGAEAGSAVLVIDAGYTPGELLVELPVSVGRLVATKGPRELSGLDLGAIEPDQIVASTTEQFLQSAGADGYVLTGRELAALPEAITSVATALSGAVTSRAAQDSLQRALLAGCRVPVIPGDAYITLGELCSAVSIPIAGVPASVPLYLVHLDELGLPDGHAPEYRRDSDATVLSPGFREIPWAPDLLRRNGALFDLWYREF